MKKKLFVLLAVLLLLLSSCGSKKEIRECFSLPMEIKCALQPNGAEFRACVYADRCEIFFENSHALSDTKLCLSDEKNTAGIEGYFEREVKKGTFPAQEALYKAVKLLSASDAVGEKYENGAKYTIDETVIMVYYDYNTETVTYIETEENGRRFLFAVTSLTVNEAQSNGAGQS